MVNCSPNPSHSNWSEKSLPQFPICLADFCQKSFVLSLKGMLVLLSKEFGGCWRLFGGWEGWMEVGWYWIVLEGEERGCGGVYHPWGNLILRRKPLQVSLNMPHTHIPSKHSRTKGGENFLVRFISGEKMTILRHRADPPEARQAFIFPLMYFLKRMYSQKTFFCLV